MYLHNVHVILPITWQYFTVMPVNPHKIMPNPDWFLPSYTHPHLQEPLSATGSLVFTYHQVPMTIPKEL